MAVIALGESLDRMGLDIAEAVVERARTELVKVPSVAQLYDVAREIRAEADEPEYPALPAAEVVAEMPEDVREKWHALQARWAGEGDRDLAAEDAEWQRVKTATIARLRMTGTCLGTDKPPVEVDGVLVCPVCRVEVPR